MDDDCVIIVESDEKQECEQKEVFVISSDSDDSNDDYASKPEKADTSLENPMYNKDDLKKTEPTEELEGDVLLQRLKKKLLAARSLKEQQSLENLIQKRREKISKGTEPPPAISSSNKARLTENNEFFMSDQSPGFRIKDPSKPEILNGNSQQGGAFWSLHERERDMGNLFETGRRFSDKDEKELKETLQSMQCALKEKSARRRKRDAGNKTAPGNHRSAVSNLSQFLQQQQQFQADFKQHFDPLACSSSRQQIQRNPRLQPYDKKSMEETQREVGLAEKLGPSNKGFTMLKAMGYKEGEGLGKEGEGRREPVTISKRQGKAGLGS